MRGSPRDGSASVAESESERYLDATRSLRERMRAGRIERRVPPGGQLSPRVRIWARVLWVTALLGLTLFSMRAVSGFPAGGEAAFGALYMYLCLVPGALCVARGTLIREERSAWVVLGVGMLCWTAGVGYYLLFMQGLDRPPDPSVCDVLCLGFYGCGFVAVMLLLRARTSGFRRGVWVDALAGALTLAALAAALVMGPLVEDTGGSVAAVATNLAYPLSDVLIVGLLLPVFASLGGWSEGRAWLTIGAAWVVLGAADTIHLYQAASRSYAAGTLLDAIHPAMMLVLAYAAWRPPGRTLSIKFDGWPLLAPLLFAVLALGLITYDQFDDVGTVGMMLALASLVLAIVRGAITFADVRSLTSSRELLARQALILNSAGEGIYGLDRDGRTVFANRAAADMTGYVEDELLGEDAHELLHHTRPEGAPYPAHRCPIIQSLENGTVEQVASELFFRKDGSDFPVEYTTTPIRTNGEVEGAVVVFRDISERLRAERERSDLERKVQQSQRMESVGQLAGGIAHDFNNLLAVILNYAVFVRDDLPEGDAARQDLAEIQGAAERAAALTRQLLLFSRSEPAHPEVLNLNSVVGGIETLLRRTIGENIELRTRLVPNLAPVKTDASQMEQVIMNLAINARDAMPDGGTLTIETKNLAPDTSGADDGRRRVGLRVADTGCGMEPKVRARAFEPFFTTKAVGEGSGFGLATVYGIVGQSGGEIQLDSQPGRGTVVEVTLPANDGQVDTPQPRRATAPPPAGGEVILLVEDQSAVREMTRRLLSRRGYEVLTADSPEAALRIFSTCQRSIDLLLTDIVMPEVSGQTLAERMRDSDPSLPVLYMSGYSDDVLGPQRTLDPGMSFLPKPFRAPALFDAVHEALTSNTRATQALRSSD